MKDRYSREIRAEILGEEKRILINLQGLILADENGFDVERLETDAEDEDDVEEMSVGERLKFLSAYVWVGLLPFDPDLELEDFRMQLALGDLPALTDAWRKIRSRQLGDEVEEQIEEVSSSGKGSEA